MAAKKTDGEVNAETSDIPVYDGVTVASEVGTVAYPVPGSDQTLVVKTN